MHYPQWDKKIHRVDFSPCCCMQVSTLNGIPKAYNRTDNSTGTKKTYKKQNRQTEGGWPKKLDGILDFMSLVRARRGWQDRV